VFEVWAWAFRLKANAHGFLITNFKRTPRNGMEKKMLWTIVVVLFILWLLGFGLHVGGGLIHLLLVVALVVFVINLISGRRRAI
jgi:hypothetical protein